MVWIYLQEVLLKQFLLDCASIGTVTSEVTEQYVASYHVSVNVQKKKKIQAVKFLNKDSHWSVFWC